MIRNTSYNVRPDRHTSAEIALLKPEESVIVYDTDEKVNKFFKWEPKHSFDDGLLKTILFNTYLCEVM